MIHVDEAANMSNKLTAPPNYTFVAGVLATAVPSPQIDVMRCNQMLQQRIPGIPLSLYGLPCLPSAASIHPMPMMPMLPVPLFMQDQHTINLGAHLLAFLVACHCILSARCYSLNPK